MKRYMDANYYMRMRTKAVAMNALTELNHELFVMQVMRSSVRVNETTVKQFEKDVQDCIENTRKRIKLALMEEYKATRGLRK